MAKSFPVLPAQFSDVENKETEAFSSIQAELSYDHNAVITVVPISLIFLAIVAFLVR